MNLRTIEPSPLCKGSHFKRTPILNLRSTTVLLWYYRKATLKMHCISCFHWSNWISLGFLVGVIVFTVHVYMGLCTNISNLPHMEEWLESLYVRISTVISCAEQFCPEHQTRLVSIVKCVWWKIAWKCKDNHRTQKQISTCIHRLRNRGPGGPCSPQNRKRTIVPSQSST